MSVRLHYDGLAEFKTALRQLVPDSFTEAEHFIQGSAVDAYNEIAAIYAQHERSGRLSRGLKIQVESTGRYGVGVVLRSSAPHAWLFENGTDGVIRKTAQGWTRGAMPPAHAFIPAMERARKSVRRFLVDLLQRQGLTVTGV